MDTILKSFSLGFLLRSVFAGAFFVLSYCVATSGYNFAAEKLISVGLPCALIAGVTVYGLHRSLIYPVLEWGFNADWAKRLRATKQKLWKQEFRWTLISQNTINNLVVRWDSKSKEGKKLRCRFNQIATWADYIHLQYTSALCIIFGSLAGVIVTGGHHPINLPLLGLFISLFIAGIVSNWRSHSVEEHWLTA
jgi:hypothetical protein